MSLLIDHILISGFRGIGDPVELDLSAPLTLLYAPNGTGKTSIFNALSWLHGRDFDENAIRHHSHRRLDTPLVHATGMLVTRDDRLSLNFERSGVSDPTGTLDGCSITGLDLLRQLAQEHDLSEFDARGGGQKTRYQKVLRATRFLSADLEEAVKLHGEESSRAELRQLLFADLTNTTNLTADRKQVKSYGDKLKERRRQCEKAQSDIQASLKDRTARVSSAPDLQSSLTAVTKSFDLAFDPDDDNRNLLAAAQRELDKWVAATALHADTLNDLHPFVITRAEDERTVESLHSQIVAASASATAFNESTRKLESDIVVLSSKHNSLQRSHEDVSKRTEQLRQLLANAPELAELPLPPELAVERGNASPIYAEVLSLCRLVSEHPQWSHALSELKQCIAAIEHTHAAVAQHPSNTASELEHADEELRAIEDSLQHEGEQREELRRLALAWQQRTGASQCPCCNHEWNTADALVEALSAQVPSRSHSVSRRIELRERTSTLRARHESLLRHESDLRLLKEKERALRSELTPYRQLASNLHIELESADLDALIAGRNEQVVTYVADLGSAAATIDTPASVSTVLGRLSKEASYLQSELAISAESLRAAKLSLSEANAESDRQRQLASSLSAQHASFAARLRQGDILAAKLSIAQVTAEAMASSRQALDTSAQHNAEASALLQGLRDALEAYEASLELPAQRERAAALKKSINEISEEIDRAERLDRFLADSITTRSAQVFKSLERPISELFGHMQINRAFQRITLERAVSGFSVRGWLDGQTELNPQEHFSQGQQQDLALSMFLARAATLGGSFFLDEPLRHLDDLNRAALLDVLRAAVLGTRGNEPPLRLLVTTASRMVLEHLVQKFRPLTSDGAPWLRAYELHGNPRTGVRCHQVYPPKQRSDPRGPSGTTPREPLPAPLPAAAALAGYANEKGLEEISMDMASLTWSPRIDIPGSPRLLPSADDTPS